MYKYRIWAIAPSWPLAIEGGWLYYLAAPAPGAIGLKY